MSGKEAAETCPMDSTAGDFMLFFANRQSSPKKENPAQCAGFSTF